MSDIDEMVKKVAEAIDAAVVSWQPGTVQSIKEAAARAAIDAMRPYIKIRETNLGCSS